MRVLFIGGTGTISSSCTNLAMASGIDLTLLNRGRHGVDVPAGVRVLTADIRDAAAARVALKGLSFDVVVDFIAYLPEHIETDLALFRGHCGQFIFISSTSAYRKPPTCWPINETCALENPFWQYSRDKIACEERLLRAFAAEKFPITIVRPAHTYDRGRLPVLGGWTVVERLRRGAPIVVHGDGTSLWTLTHARDFATGLIGLFGNQRAIGEAVHITGNELLTWNDIYRAIARAAGGPEPQLVHVPSEIIARFNARWGESLLGDKSHSLVFDNRKIRSLVPEFAAPTPYSEGAAETIRWHDTNASLCSVDPAFEAVFERLIASMSEIQADGLPTRR